MTLNHVLHTFRLSLVTAGVVVLLPLHLQATTVDWRNEASSGNWEEGGSPCAEIGTPASQWWYAGWGPNNSRNRPDCFGDRHIRFDNNHQTTMTLNGGSWYNAAAIQFSANATTARTMNGAQGIDFNAANQGITNNSTATHVFNVGIAFNANPITFRLNDGNLTFNSNIFFKGNFMDVLGNNWHTLNLNGVLNRDGGDGGIAVKENTLVVITNNNTITGAIWVEKGIVRFGGGTNAMGNSGTVNIGTNAAVELTYAAGEVLRPSSWNLYGTGTNGTGALKKTSGSGNVTLPGTVVLQQNAAIRSDGGSLIISNVVSGSGVLTKVGAGELVMAGNNTYSGITYVSNGTLRITHTNGLGTTAGGTFVRDGATLHLDVTGGYPAETIAIVGNGVASVGAINSTVAGNLRGQINLDGNARIRHTTGTLTLSGLLNLSNRTLTVENNTAVEMASGASISNATLTTGSGAIVKEGSSHFILRPSSDMTGSITVNAGELRLGPNASGSGLVAGGTLTLAGDTRLSSDGTAGRTVAKNTAISGGLGLAINSSGNLTFNGTVDLGSAVRVITNANGVLFNGAITGSGGGITKRGDGTMTNAANNTYTGATTIEAGTLVMIGTSSNSAHTVSSGGTLTGTGTVGQLTVNGIVSPGIATNSINTLRSMTLSLGQNGRLIFNINNVAGTPGTNWDLLSVSNGTGAISVDATSGNPFEITLISSSVTGWDNSVNHSWRIVDGGSVSGFAANKFTFNTTSFTPALGGGTFSVTNDGSDLYLVFTAAGGPDIEARGNNLIIANGSTTPSLADHTDFGDVLTTGGSLTRTYTFTNAGIAAVGLGNISFSGGNAADFTVVNQLPATLAAGGSTNIQITFDPGADGTRNTTLTFTNTVTGKTPYTFLIQGTGITRNIDVRGNDQIIADGDSTPSLTDHTDFGNVGVAGATLTRTFSITNTGNRPVGLGNVTVSGSHAADFSVTTQPADEIAAGAITTFQITFDPSAVGLRSASLSFTNTTSTGKNPYNFDIQGAGAGSGISNFPTSLSFSSVLGSVPVAQAFSVTNVGLGTMTYSLATNVNWLRLSNNTFTAAAGAGNVHTAHVQNVGVMAVGVSNAAITITGDSATTNSPKTINVAWTISAIPDPTAVVVQGEGAEFVRLFWTKNVSYDVIIVHRATNAPSVPLNNTLYNVGDAVGSDGSRVLYKGAASTFEHVVIPGTTNHYAFYSINNNYYSPGVSGFAANPVYPSGVAVESFSYTNALTMGGRNGGSGWSGGWTANFGTYTVISNLFTAISGYPASGGNSITGNNASIRRDFAAVTSGRLYVSFMMRTDNGGGSQYSGLSFFDDATEEKFFGEGFFQVNQLTVGSASGRQLANNTDYTIIAMYDFENDVAKALLYTNATESVPVVEPGTWHVEEADATISSINRIRLESNVGTRWDEVRIATNWNELLQITGTPPYATNYVIGNTTNHVSDAQVNQGAFPVIMALRSADGVESTNTVSPYFLPNFDLMNPAGTEILTDRVFSAFSYQSGGLTLIASNNGHATVLPAAITLGVYTARWSAVSSNGFEAINIAALSNGTPITFTVFDDDVDPPTIMQINSPESGASRNMHITSNTTAVGAVGGTSGTNISYRLSDQYLASNLSASTPLVFYFGARDAGSGLNRGNESALTNSSLTIGSAIVSNVLQWDTTRSSAFTNTYSANATNAWSWITPFSATEIENLVTNTSWGVPGSNRVTLTWRDADDDRLNDQSTLFDQQHGWLVVFDDDIVPPTIQNFRIWGAEGSYTVRVDELTSGTGWAITGRVSDTSGINVNGTNTVQPDNSPYFELWDPNGALRFRQAFTGIPFADGEATTLSSISNGAEVVSGVTFADVGVWTARVVVADNDEDFGVNDHAIGTNAFSFTVVLGDTLGGLSRAPAFFAVTSSFGTVTSTNPWPQFFVTNVGSGTLNYNASISYSGAGGWLTVTPTNGVLAGTGASRGHTNTIDASGLSPGTYTATITLNGDQTNAAQTVTVHLRVFGYYPGEIVEPFTNATGSLEGMVGGSGWSGAWDNNPDAGFSIDAGNLTVPGNYPAAAGNKACGNTAGDTELRTVRSFNTTFSTGKIFMAVAVRKSDGNADGFNGISFMSNNTEVVFAGKLFGSANFGIDLGGNGGSVASTFGANGTGDPGYFYVGVIDFGSNRVYGRAYNNSDVLPLTEPTWQVTNTPSVAIGSVNGIRLAARQEGTVCFDEVRVATSWEGLLNLFTNEPTVHASGMNFRDVEPTGMVVGWTPGNGANRIVVAREGAAVDFLPLDNTSYGADPNFAAATDLGGGNKVVYNGGGTNFSLTGLSPATRYHFAIFEYNGATPNYFTNAGYAIGSRWTVSTEPAENATALAAFTAGDTSISNTWVAAGGSPAASGYLILRSFAAVTSAPMDGVSYTNNQALNGAVVSLVTPGSATTYLHTGLVSCSNYHFRIFAFRWNGTDGETYNYNTNAASTATAETSCEAPDIQASDIVFTLIGTNRIGLTWQNGNGQGRVVIVRGTNAVSQNPVDGASYTADTVFGNGSHLGDGNFVVFSGTGSVVEVTGLFPGSTYHFRVFEFNGAGSGTEYNINTNNGNPRSTATASFGIVEDKFDYGAGNIFAANGGTGWTNAWGTLSGQVDVSNGNFPAFGAYPEDTGTRQGYLNSTTKRSAHRNFPPRTSGKLYFAIKVNLGATAQNAFFGVNILNGAASGGAGDNSVTGFFGKAFGVADNKLSLDHNGTTRTNRLDGSNAGYTLNTGFGNDYLLVALYDFDAKEFKVRAYTTDQLAHADPNRENAWLVEMNNVHIDRIDGIEIIGEGLGDCYFDHVRIGPSWEEVMWNLPDNWHEDNGPVPTLVYIGTNYNSAVYDMVITNLSDAELKSAGLIDFAVRWDSPSGVFVQNTTTNHIGSPDGRITPNWDPLAIGAATNPFNLDRFFTNAFGVNGATSVTTYQFAAFNITNIDFELQYFVTVSAETDPGGATVTAPGGGAAVPVTRAITINEPLRFYVYDDDTNAPTLGSRPLRVLTNTTIASAQSVGDLERYFVFDGVLADAGMTLMLNAYDDYSGLQRASAGTADTNFNITVPFVATNNIANFNEALSSTTSTGSATTSAWVFANTLFTYDRLSTMWGGDGTALQGQDIEITATIPDADNDRVDDQMFLSNAVMGFIRLLDDDIDPPEPFTIHYAGAAGRPFFAATNGVAIGSGDTLIRGTYARRTGTGSNTVFAITDEELALAGSRALQLTFGARDVHSGILRGTSGDTNVVMSFSIGEDIFSGHIGGWNAGLSTPVNAPNVPQTNIWTFSDGFFSTTVITQLMAVTGPSGSGSNRVAVTIPDSDNDRTNDTATLYSATVGWLQVFDDDITGPLMSFADVVESTGGDTIVATSFETSEGWPNSNPSTSPWAVTNSYGIWSAEGVLHTTFDPKNTGIRRIGMLTNTFPQPFLQFPPVDNPGRISIYAARVSGGSGTPQIRLERRDGSAWTDLGARNVTNTSYEQLNWDIDMVNSLGVTLRMVRVDTGTSRSQVYLDDLSINSTPQWISADSITITWTEAVDDFSGINYYRVVPPVISSIPPLTTNDGVFFSAATTSAVIDITGNQGVLTGHVFAVDNDDDRPDDNAMGNYVTVLVRVDTNPPPRVGALRATDAASGDLFDTTIDESSEIKVEWSAFATEAEAAGWRNSDQEPLSPWDSYIITYYEVADTNGTPVANAVTTVLDRTLAAWSNTLHTHTFTNLVLSNLNFDAYYTIAIQGRDLAGNIGLATNVIGNTDRFAVTQAIARVGLGVNAFWTGPTNELVFRDYDVLYVESPFGFRNTMSNQWQLLMYTNRPTLVDTGAVGRVAPGLLTGTTYRFYRVAKQDRWQTNNLPRLGSPEVYATKGLSLNQGENWHSMFAFPDPATTNETLGTVAHVFGTNLLPRGVSSVFATKITWFGTTVSGDKLGSAPTATVWLANSGWTYLLGGAGSANDKRVPLNQGFLIELPISANPTNFPLIGRLPTQEIVHVISGAGASVTNPTYHILSHAMPERVSLIDLGISTNNGFVGGPNIGQSDEIRILSNSPTNNLGSGSLIAPKARIFWRTTDNTWREVIANIPASNYVIEPDDAVIFVRRHPTTITWTNRPVFYSPPTRNFTP